MLNASNIASGFIKPTRLNWIDHTCRWTYTRPDNMYYAFVHLNKRNLPWCNGDAFVDDWVELHTGSDDDSTSLIHH